MSTLQLISRGQVLKRLNVSDSTERRRRQSGENWPAHVVVGSRILYSERAIADFIAAEEAANTGTGTGPAGVFSPEVQAAVERRAAELVAEAPPLTARQIVQLRAIFASPAAGGGSR